MRTFGSQQVDEWIFLSICMCVCVWGGVADGSALVAEVTQMDLLPVRQVEAPLEKDQKFKESLPW